VAPGVVDHHEAAAADAARERLHHAEDAGGRHRRVDGVAAGSQDFDRRLGGERVDGGGRAARSLGGGRLRRGWDWHPRPCRERGDQRHQDRESQQTGDA
jgi:hypothetical protein